MDTLAAYLSSGHITKALEHERLAAVQRTWRESFGHPAHRDMLADHNERVREFYGRGNPGIQPGTPTQINELVDAVTGYHPAKKYTKGKLMDQSSYVEVECLMPGLGWGACPGFKCTYPKRTRTVTDWVETNNDETTNEGSN